MGDFRRKKERTYLVLNPISGSKNFCRTYPLNYISLTFILPWKIYSVIYHSKRNWPSIALSNRAVGSDKFVQIVNPSFSLVIKLNYFRFERLRFRKYALIMHWRNQSNRFTRFWCITNYENVLLKAKHRGTHWSTTICCRK